MIQVDYISHLACTASQIERMRHAAPPRQMKRGRKKWVGGRTDKRDLKVTDGISTTWAQ